MKADGRRQKAKMEAAKARLRASTSAFCLLLSAFENVSPSNFKGIVA